MDDPGTIVLSVHKKDSETDSDQASGNASLAGAVYRVSYLVDGQMVCKDITTNSKGVTGLNKIPLGQITVQEITAPIGYKLDPTVHTYNITTLGTGDVYELEPEDFTEDVFKGKIALHKQYETLDDRAEEQGAEFDVYLKSAGSYEQPKRPSATISPPARMAWQPQRIYLTAHTSCIKQRAATAVSL